MSLSAPLRGLCGFSPTSLASGDEGNGDTTKATPTASFPLIVEAGYADAGAMASRWAPRCRAYWRRILARLPHPSMLHQRRVPFLLVS